jgi:hypothetical protein
MTKNQLSQLRSLTFTLHFFDGEEYGFFFRVVVTGGDYSRFNIFFLLYRRCTSKYYMYISGYLSISYEQVRNILSRMMLGIDLCLSLRLYLS